ncbi:mast cell protease 1A-like [Drosophila gunungcola]|uniref:mast cell protease 1A-like n=1 Tax=Drosophila gunungcola TaxID=103775 RepID=UPI0022E879FC|nr:mast cell protease 1A-like [Drosophila gunungcola]
MTCSQFSSIFGLKMSVLSLALFALLSFDQGSAKLLDTNCAPFVEYGLRIIGGEDAQNYYTPWIASLYNSAKEFIGAGTLINKRFVLTVAHVLEGNLEFVRLGEKDRSCITSNCSVIKEYSVDRAIKHPYYFNRNNKLLKNDVAMLRLNFDVEYNEFIKPICIIVDEEVNLADINKIRAFGWGVTQPFGREYSDTLKTIFLDLRSSQECLQSLNVSITDEQICAGSATGGDTSTGDSGGPMAGNYIYEGKNKFVQIGIVSYGSQGGNNSAIYTNVLRHRKWILSVLRTHGQRLLYEECGGFGTWPFFGSEFEDGPYELIACTQITDRFCLTSATSLSQFSNYVWVPLNGNASWKAEIQIHPEFYVSRGQMRNNLALLKPPPRVSIPEFEKPPCIEVNTILSATFPGNRLLIKNYPDHVVVGRGAYSTRQGTNSSRYFLEAIFSHIDQYGEEYYINVSAYEKWIREVVEK